MARLRTSRETPLRANLLGQFRYTEVTAIETRKHPQRQPRTSHPFRLVAPRHMVFPCITVRTRSPRRCSAYPTSSDGSLTANPRATLPARTSHSREPELQGLAQKQRLLKSQRWKQSSAVPSPPASSQRKASPPRTLWPSTQTRHTAKKIQTTH